MGSASEESRIAPRGSQQLPKGFQALLGPKLSVPQTKAFRGEKNSPRRGHSGTKQTTYCHIKGINGLLEIELMGG